MAKQKDDEDRKRAEEERLRRQAKEKQEREEAQRKMEERAQAPSPVPAASPSPTPLVQPAGDAAYQASPAFQKPVHTRAPDGTRGGGSPTASLTRQVIAKLLSRCVEPEPRSTFLCVRVTFDRRPRLNASVPSLCRTQNSWMLPRRTENICTRRSQRTVPQSRRICTRVLMRPAQQQQVKPRL